MPVFPNVAFYRILEVRKRADQSRPGLRREGERHVHPNLEAPPAARVPAARVDPLGAGVVGAQDQGQQPECARSPSATASERSIFSASCRCFFTRSQAHEW